MDIHLDTKTNAEALSLLNISKLGNKDFECLLYVKSDWIECTRTFYFNDFYARKFLDELVKMNTSLTGIAKLKMEYEQQHICFTCTNRGRVIVDGKLIEHRELSQEVIFGFETDQTVLSNLIRDFGKLL